MAIAAGDGHSLAFAEQPGKVVAWGNDASGQTNVITGLNGVKLIAGGGDFSLAGAIFANRYVSGECLAGFAPDLQYKLGWQHDR